MIRCINWPHKLAGDTCQVIDGFHVDAGASTTAQASIDRPTSRRYESPIQNLEYSPDIGDLAGYTAWTQSSHAALIEKPLNTFTTSLAILCMRSTPGNGRYTLTPISKGLRQRAICKPTLTSLTTFASFTTRWS